MATGWPIEHQSGASVLPIPMVNVLPLNDAREITVLPTPIAIAIAQDGGILLHSIVITAQIAELKVEWP